LRSNDALMQGYAICSIGRSGSNWLCELLTSTGRLGRPLEYFDGNARRMLTDPAYPDDPVEQIQRVLTMGATPNGVYGVKVFPWHVDAIRDRVRWAEALPNLHFVHLVREDVLGQAISLCRVNQTGRFRSPQSESSPPFYDGETIRGHIHLFARANARWTAFFARVGVQPLRLVYEQITRDPQRTADAVSNLLQVARTRVDLSRVEQTMMRDDLSEEWRRRFIAEFGDANIVDQL
jgi:LPS sulfotransferase NodH